MQPLCKGYRHATTLRAARHLRMPDHHEVRAENINLKHLGAVLAVAYERDLHDFAELLLLENLGPRTLQSLALPKLSMAHQAASPIPHGFHSRTVARIVIHSLSRWNFLRTSLDAAAKVSDKEKVDGFRQLERFSRAVETQLQAEANFAAVLAQENPIFPSSTAVRFSMTSLVRDVFSDFGE